MNRFGSMSRTSGARLGLFVWICVFAINRVTFTREIPEVGPRKAYEMVQAPGVRLVDVRSVAEYVWVGHPVMAHNVPIAFWDETKQSLVPNTAFAEDLKVRFKPEDTLVFICRSGGRSLRAAQAARSAGFLKVINVDEGFEGELDDQGHRTIGGWKNSGLPYTQELNPELKYRGLSEREK